MFNQKLKQEVENLKNQLKEKDTQINLLKKQVENLKFEIENPPKFKVGDKIGNLIVVERKFKVPDISDVLRDHFMMYSIVTSAFMRIPMPKNTQEYSKKTFEKGYIYDCVNVITGEKSTKKEAELIN
jgi:seryl-tRNA synthetase